MNESFPKDDDKIKEDNKDVKNKDIKKADKDFKNDENKIPIEKNLFFL
jgi:hypothetical protein